MAKREAKTKKATEAAPLAVGDSVSIPCTVVEVTDDLVTLETALPSEASGESNRFAVHASQLILPDNGDDTNGE